MSKDKLFAVGKLQFSTDKLIRDGIRPLLGFSAYHRRKSPMIFQFQEDMKILYFVNTFLTYICYNGIIMIQEIPVYPQ